MTNDFENAGPRAAATDETKAPGHLFAMAVCLAGLAGYVDATGYIHFHRLFVSFMSGNSTQAAVAVASFNMGQFGELARTVALFVVGVTMGELLGALSKRWGRSIILGLEVATLCAATIVTLDGLPGALASSLLGFAMGMQNATVHKADGINVALTYVTGTLVHVGRGIAGALRGAAPWHAVVPFIGLWLGLVCGGLLGAFMADRSLFAALIGADAIAAALLVWSIGVSINTPAEKT